MKIFPAAAMIFLALAPAVEGAENAPELRENPLPGWALGGFVRPEGANPAISPNPASVFDCPMAKAPIRWEESDTFNPAAAVFNGKICVLYRAEDDTHRGIGSRTSRLGLAESDDGVRMRRLPAPVLYPDEDAAKEFEWTGGCEDPRLAKAEDGTYVLTYTAWNKENRKARLCVATSRDLRKWTKHGPAFAKAYGGKYRDLYCKSGSILTERSPRRPDEFVAAKVGGRYFMYWGEHRVFGAYSDDLINWTPVENPDGSLRAAISPRRGFFDSLLTECGPAAIRTPKGCLLLYNGKNAGGENGDARFNAGAYCAGQALFDADNPMKPVARLDAPFFRPMEDFEKSGQYRDGTVFIEGLAYFKGKWFLYYGCADSKVGVAVFDPKRRTPGDPLPAARK